MNLKRGRIGINPGYTKPQPHPYACSPESGRQRLYKIFPNAEKRYLQYLKEKNNVST